MEEWIGWKMLVVQVARERTGGLPTWRDRG